MLKDPQHLRYAVRRTHRTYTPQFKAELVAACLLPGASIAALALQHGMNANVLHRWFKEYQQGCHRLNTVATTADVPPHSAAFVPIALAGATPSRADERPVAAAPAMAQDIRIECQRPGVSVTVHWPVSDAAECAQMLRELLR